MLCIGVVEVGCNAPIPLSTHQQQRGAKGASDEEHGRSALGTGSGDGRDSQIGVKDGSARLPRKERSATAWLAKGIQWAFPGGNNATAIPKEDETSSGTRD
jgi:hypothetical protein